MSIPNPKIESILNYEMIGITDMKTIQIIWSYFLFYAFRKRNFLLFFFQLLTWHNNNFVISQRSTLLYYVTRFSKDYEKVTINIDGLILIWTTQFYKYDKPIK